MNLEQIIDQWIEGNDINIFDSNIMAQGYIDCKKDLKSRKQELIEEIEKLYSERLTNIYKQGRFDVEIEKLTGK